MIELRFGGWFQCRLATDPDPCDEKRGVSGYVHAFVDEPDLDRLISFQRPAFLRSHAPHVGVHVLGVSVDGEARPDHPLVGAAVDLLERPVFEGRNGAVADDGLEPIHPFVLEVSAPPFRLVRATVPADPAYPYPEFLASGVDPTRAQEIAEATGVANLRSVWQQRLAALRLEVQQGPPEPRASGLRERISFLEGNLGSDGGVLRFFGAAMTYHYVLRSQVIVEDPSGWLCLGPAEMEGPWLASFWLGGWDADVLCGYASGTMRIGGPAPAPGDGPTGRVGRAADRRP